MALDVNEAIAHAIERVSREIQDHKSFVELCRRSRETLEKEIANLQATIEREDEDRARAVVEIGKLYDELEVLKELKNASDRMRRMKKEQEKSDDERDGQGQG